MEDRGRFSVFFCRLWKTGDGSLSSFVDCHSRQRTVPCPYVSTSSLPKRLPLMRELSAKLTEGENGFSLLPSRLAPCHLPRQRKAFLGREQGNLSLAPICRLSLKTENRPLSFSPVFCQDREPSPVFVSLCSKYNFYRYPISRNTIPFATAFLPSYNTNSTPAERLSGATSDKYSIFESVSFSQSFSLLKTNTLQKSSDSNSGLVIFIIGAYLSPNGISLRPPIVSDNQQIFASYFLFIFHLNYRNTEFKYDKSEK